MRQSSDIILNGWIFFEVKLQRIITIIKTASVKIKTLKATLVIGKEQVEKKQQKKKVET